MSNDELKIHHIATDKMEQGEISPRSYANQYSQINLNFTNDEAYIMRTLLSKLELRIQEINSSISNSLIENKESLFTLIAKIHKLEQQLYYLLSMFQEQFHNTLERSRSYSTAAITASKLIEKFNEVEKELHVIELSKKCDDCSAKLHQHYQLYTSQEGKIEESISLLQIRMIGICYSKTIKYAKLLSEISYPKELHLEPLISKIMKFTNTKLAFLLQQNELYISSSLCTVLQMYSLMEKSEDLYSYINKTMFDCKALVESITANLSALISKVVRSEKAKEELQCDDDSFPLKQIYDYMSSILSPPCKVWAAIQSQPADNSIDICVNCVWKHLYKNVLLPHITGIFVLMHPIILVKSRLFSIHICELISQHARCSMKDDEEMKKLMSYSDAKGIISLALPNPMNNK